MAGEFLLGFGIVLGLLSILFMILFIKSGHTVYEPNGQPVMDPKTGTPKVEANSTYLVLCIVFALVGGFFGAIGNAMMR